MPSEVVIENGRRVLKVPGGQGIDLGPADQAPASKQLATREELNDPSLLARMGKGLVNDPMSRRLTRAASNPETVAGAAGVLLAPETGGLSMAIPAAVGAATAGAQDYFLEGQRDPLTIGGDMLLHGGINAIPGAVGNITHSILSRAPSAVMELGNAMPGKIGVVSRVLSALRGVPQVTSAGPQVASAAGELADMTLPSGAKVLSSQGLRELVQHSIDLENKGAPKAQVQAVDALIQKVRSAIAPGNQAPAQLLQQTGLPTGSITLNAQQAAAAAKAAQATRTATRVKRALYGASAAGSQLDNAIGSQP